MQKEFWNRRWQKNEIGFHENVINTYLKQYWSALNAPQNRTVFVPLCGKSLDMLWLYQQGYAILGVELSAIAVHDFFAEQQLTPHVTPYGKFERWQTGGITLLVGDFFDLSPADLVECGSIYDRASLIALPPPMRQQYATHFQHIAPPHAPTLLITLEYPQAEMQGPPFAVLESEVHALYAEHFTVERLLDQDTLASHTRFQQRGLTHLHEKVYHLS